MRTAFLHLIHAPGPGPSRPEPGASSPVGGARPRWLRSRRVTWLGAACVIGLLAWQGHHLAHLIPRIEAWISSLGPWAPLAYFVGAFLLVPLMVPDSLLAVVAGVVFGMVEGFAIYFPAVYLASLLTFWLGRRWLRVRVLALLKTRPDLDAMASAARREGVQLTFWIRLIPLNPALVSYALGAVGVSLRAVAIGSFGMLPHMLLGVYVGAAAAHVTQMAGDRHQSWTVEGAGFVLGLVACAALVAQVSRLAGRRIQQAERAASSDADR